MSGMHTTQKIYNKDSHTTDQLKTASKGQYHTGKKEYNPFFKKYIYNNFLFYITLTVFIFLIIVYYIAKPPKNGYNIEFFSMNKS